MHPLWLLLDTACPRAVVALVRSAQVLSEVYLENYRQHGENLPNALASCLEQAQLSIEDVNQVAVGTGPGSFIGLRIAMAYAKGFCVARQIPLLGFNTLSGISPEGASYVAIDARRNEFYVFEVATQTVSLVQKLPENTYVELKGPTARQIALQLPDLIQDQTLTLLPNYIRDGL